MKEPVVSPFSHDTPAWRLRLRRRFLQGGILFLVCLGLAAFFLAHLNFKERTGETESALERRLEILADSRVDVIETWLSGLISSGDRVIQSDIFRLYAAEVDLIAGDVSLIVQGGPLESSPQGDPLSGLREQLPMMVNLLKEFVAYSGFLSGRIVDRNGRSYVATDGETVALSEDQKDRAADCLGTGSPRYAPLRKDRDGLILDIFLPIFPPGGATDAPDTAVAVLMLSKPVSTKLNEILAGSPLAREWERTRLVQTWGGGVQEVLPGTGQGVVDLDSREIGEGDPLPFAARNSLDGKTTVYSLALKVPGLRWWVVQESDVSRTQESLGDYKKAVVTLIALTLIALALILGSIWWRIIGVENRKIAEQFKQFAERIEGQHRFLESINSAVADCIGFKDREGLYRYVNPAFARAVGREIEDLIGTDDRAVFGFDTANRLGASDRAALDQGRAVTLREKIYLLSRPRHFLITKVPFRGGDGGVAGIVSVLTDVTPLIEAQQKGERIIRQTIAAFVKTIEMIDPYLAGHSRRMSALAKALARDMGTDEQTRLTVEFGALLSQIGKVFIDRALLTKAGVLTDGEREEVRKNLDHAVAILQGMDFDLPVSETVYQMYEKADGSGYPRGLKEGEILVSAGILGAVNRFCALVRPRAYRPALSPGEALSAMGSTGGACLAGVLESLNRVVASSEGEKILQGLDPAG